MRRTGAASLLLAFAVLGGCKSAPAPLTDADRASAQTMMTAMSTAVGSGDVAGLVAPYAPDAMLMPPAMPPVHGADAIRQFYHEMMGVKVNLTLTQQTADGSGDFMYTSGTYRYQDSTGTEDGKYLMVFKRGPDGTWKIVAESWSPNAAPQPVAPAAPTSRQRGR